MEVAARNAAASLGLILRTDPSAVPNLRHEAPQGDPVAERPRRGPQRICSPCAVAVRFIRPGGRCAPTLAMQPWTPHR